MNRFKQLPLLLCGCIFLFAACEHEEEMPVNGEAVILIPPTGDPVPITFTISENSYEAGTDAPVLRTAPSEGVAFPPPSGESERVSFSLISPAVPTVPIVPTVSNVPSYSITSTIKAPPPAITLRSTTPFNHPGKKLRIVAYDTLSVPNTAILLTHADYEVDPAGNLAHLDAYPMSVPTGSVFFVAYSFNDTLTMPPFSPTVTAIGNRDLLRGDTLATIDHTNTNVHLRLDHLFSKITLEVEVDNGNPSAAIQAIYGARYDHTFPALTVQSGNLTPGITDTLHFAGLQATGSQSIWQSDDHYAYTHGDPPIVTVDSITIDGTTHTGPPWTTGYTRSLAAGSEYILYMGFIPDLTVTPDNLNFAWNNTTVAETVTVTTIHTNWTVAGIPGWLTVMPQSGSGNGSITIVPNNPNSSILPRMATITITAGSRTETVTVRQGVDIGTIPARPSRPLPNPYVGAFWRAGETGERIIYFRNVTYTIGNNVGPWTAEVAWMDGRWAAGDIVLAAGGSDDPGITYNAATESPGNAENPLYAVPGNAQFISGYVASGGDIVFRIGLKSQFSTSPQYASSPAYPYTTHYPARYAIVTISYGNPVMIQKLFLRQGEDPDYLMRPDDLMTVAAEGLTDVLRPDAVKFSPYNLTDPLALTNPPLAFNRDIGYRGGGFTQYPSQTGAIFQWACNTYPRYAWDPVTPGDPAALIGGAWSNSYPNGTTDFWQGGTSTNLHLIHETCPVGYTLSDGSTASFRRPNDGITDAENTAGLVYGSEIRQSLSLNPLSGDNVTASDVGNTVTGYYADGFFDRRQIVPIPTNTQNTAVSATTNDIAFRGLLFYNPVTNASLFFPTSGYRNYSPGMLMRMGDLGYYWSSSSSFRGNGFVVGLYNLYNVTHSNPSRNLGCMIRCVPE